MRKKSLSNVFLVVLITFLGIYIHYHSNDFKSLLSVSFGGLALIIICHVVSIFFNGMFIKLSITPFQKHISYRQSFYVSLITTVGNYFFPVGVGTGIKAVYLKKKIKLSYTDFLATLSGNYIIVFLFNSGLGLLALFILKDLAPAGQFLSMLVLLGGIFATMLVLALYGFPRKLIELISGFRYMKGIVGHISDVLRGWNIITNHKKLLIQLIGLTACNFILSALIAEVAARSLGFSLGFWQLILYAALASLSILLNITPGSIGIRETIFIVYSTILGLTVAKILSISIIVNGTLFFVLIISWLIMRFPIAGLGSVTNSNDKPPH